MLPYLTKSCCDARLAIDQELGGQRREGVHGASWQRARKLRSIPRSTAQRIRSSGLPLRGWASRAHGVQRSRFWRLAFSHRS